MKVNANQLRRIIKRETDKVLKEQRSGSPHDLYSPEGWWDGSSEDLEKLRSISRRIDDYWSPPNAEWPLISLIMDLDHHLLIPHDLLITYDGIKPGVLDDLVQLYIDVAREAQRMVDAAGEDDLGAEAVSIIQGLHDDNDRAVQALLGNAPKELTAAGHKIPSIKTTSIEVDGEEMVDQGDGEDGSVVIDREEEVEEVEPVNEMISRHIKMLEKKFSTKGRSRRRR